MSDKDESKTKRKQKFYPKRITEVFSEDTLKPSKGVKGKNRSSVQIYFIKVLIELLSSFVFCHSFKIQLEKPKFGNIQDYITLKQEND